MTERWKQVDDYLMERVVGDDAALTNAVERAGTEGLPPIQVSGPQGKLLELLVRMMGARRVLEVGTLGGYSTIRLARGVGQGGTVVTLELDPHHASVARENLDGAGLSGRVDLREGRAIDSLDRMIAEGVEPFDFFFIDADKSSNPTYLEHAVALSRPGSVIVVDNVVRDGRILDEGSDSPDIVGTRALFDQLHDHPRLEATAIQMVGSKGYDGFALAVVGP